MSANDVPKNSADWNPTATLFYLFGAAQIDDVADLQPKLRECLERIKQRGITTNTDVGFFAVVSNPPDVAWCEFRIQEAEEPRWTRESDTYEDLFYTDDPAAV